MFQPNTPDFCSENNASTVDSIAVLHQSRDKKIKEAILSFLQKQVHVVNSERGKLLVRSLKVKQESTKGDKNSPTPS